MAERSRGWTGLPGWLLLPAALGALLVLLPLVAVVARVRWSQFVPLVTSESSRAALGLSLRTASASTVLCVLLGVPMALVLARGRFRGQRVLRSLVLLPLVLPPVVGGIALSGGRGTPLQAALGAVLIAVLQNFMLLNGFSAGLRMTIVGALVVAAISVFHVMQGKKR